MQNKIEEYKAPPDSTETTLPMSMDEFQSLPGFSRIPVFVQQILALCACGFSPKSIAECFNRPLQTIVSYINQYDPDRRFWLTKEARRAFIAKLLEARVGEALLHITPEKLKRSSAKELAIIAGKLQSTLKMISVQEREKPTNVADAMLKIAEITTKHAKENEEREQLQDTV